MKKNVIYLLIICILILTLTTGCLESDKLDGSNITATVYPIEYLVKRLYNTGDINSIYPNDTDISTYTLTEKQINDFSNKTTLFVYNGLTNEKDIAKTLVNKNKKIQIIDVSYGLNYRYGVEELWLNPNNYLMLANTIKTNLQELSSSKYAAEDIEKNFKVLEEELSTLDANMRNLAKAALANNKGTIVIGYDAFGFLEKYGFEVINISKENNITTSIKNKFKNKTYTHIYVADKNNVTDSIKDIVDNYGAILVEIDTMSTLTDEQRSNKEDYLSIMRNFINNLGNIVLS